MTLLDEFRLAIRVKPILVVEKPKRYVDRAAYMRVYYRRPGVAGKYAERHQRRLALVQAEKLARGEVLRKPGRPKKNVGAGGLYLLQSGHDVDCHS